jgi:hypothetical protein
MEMLRENLEKEALSLRDQIATATHRLDEIEVFLRLADQFTARYKTDRELANVRVENGMLRQISQRDRVVATVASVLLDGRPRGVRELRAELEIHGVRVGGADPHQTISTYLSRDPKFKSRVTGNGWVWTLSPAMATGSPREWVESLRNRLVHEPHERIPKGGGG